jgi:hypothetical protein
VEKLAPAKFQVIWTPFGSLKVKNIEKEVFWFSQVNHWGTCELFPIIIKKHEYNQYMMQIRWNIKW